MEHNQKNSGANRPLKHLCLDAQYPTNTPVFKLNGECHAYFLVFWAILTIKPLKLDNTTPLFCGNLCQPYHTLNRLQVNGAVSKITVLPAHFFKING